MSCTSHASWRYQWTRAVACSPALTLYKNKYTTASSLPRLASQRTLYGTCHWKTCRAQESTHASIKKPRCTGFCGWEVSVESTMGQQLVEKKRGRNAWKSLISHLLMSIALAIMLWPVSNCCFFIPDHGYKELTNLDFTEFIVVSVLSGVLLIFSVVGSVYVLRGYWVRTRLFDSNFNRFELLFYGARDFLERND